MSDNKNTGHGHVFPRPDGVRARCGGPGLCAECSRDLARKNDEPPKAETPPTSKKRSRAKLMPRAIAAGQRFAKRAEKLPYFQSATDAYMRGWMAGYRAHRNDVEPPLPRRFGFLRSR